MSVCLMLASTALDGIGGKVLFSGDTRACFVMFRGVSRMHSRLVSEELLSLLEQGNLLLRGEAQGGMGVHQLVASLYLGTQLNRL